MKHTKIPAYVIIAAAIVISSTSLGTRQASASTPIMSSSTANFSWRGYKEGHKNKGGESQDLGNSGIFGTISLINGNSITIISTKNGTTTYTVDASNAKIVDPSSPGATSTTGIASLKIGDVVAVRGVITGTSVAATSIFDGKFKHGPSGKNNPAAIKARHYQGIVGTVSSVNGSTILVDGKEATSTGTTTYTVDASSAKILKTSVKGKATISDISAGDSVRISGNINSTSVVAKVVLDGIRTK